MRRRATLQVEVLEQRWMPNAAPIVHVLSDKPAYNMGDNALFSASVTDPDGGNPATFSYFWDFNYDGATFNPMAGGSSASYMFPAPGNYDIAVQVTDNDGDTTVADAWFTVTDVPPTANAGPNQVAQVGTPVTFNGSGTYPGDPGSALTYEWNFNYDGTTFHTDATGASATNTYAAAGTYLAALRVTDEFGGTAISEATVTVNPKLATDIGLDGVTTPHGDNQVHLAYHIDAAAALTADIALTLYATESGAIDAGAKALGTTTIHAGDLDLAGNPALAPGNHAIQRSTSDLGFPTDGWKGSLTWKDYYLVARIDSNSAVAESSLANNDAVYSGVYQVAGSRHVFVQGTDAADLVTVQGDRHSLTVGFDGQAFTYNTRTVDAVVTRLHGGDDVLQGLKSPVPLVAWAGAGNDTLEGGNHVSVFFGGSGNDTLTGHSIFDLFFAGSGHDRIVHQPHWSAWADWLSDLPWVINAEVSLWRHGFFGR